ncbi:histidine kinase [uncultured Croceitalea sp.]|uniref:sensor histidine kinase n=1 Tax=uncultured Croceitalea sp. TaxID=1798908 RepID=UPI0033058B44
MGKHFGKLIDKKLVQVLLVYYLIAYIIDFVGTVLIYHQQNELDVLIRELLIQYGVFFVTKLAYIFTALLLTKKIFGGKTLNPLMLSVHLLLASLLAFYTAGIGLLLDVHVFSKVAALSIESIFIRGLSGLSFNFFVYFSMIAIVYAYQYLIQQKKDELEASQLKTKLLDSKVKALQAQLNPHFLFNALNGISSLINDNKLKAQDAIADLSYLLRCTLNLQETKLTRFQDELSLLKTYINMERLRYDDKWLVDLDIPKELDEYLIPPLLLQPFIENTIKHGFSEKHQNIKTQIWARLNGDVININIVNNGKPLEIEPPVFGLGIGNVLARLNSLFRGDFDFKIFNDSLKSGEQTGSVVWVKLQLPALRV